MLAGYLTLFMVASVVCCFFTKRASTAYMPVRPLTSGEPPDFENCFIVTTEYVTRQAGL
jgi:hypothetical protein